MTPERWRAITEIFHGAIARAAPDREIYLAAACQTDPSLRADVDAMIAALLQARGREDFVAAVRALDRLLISGFYTIPLFHLPDQWIARWSRIARPKEISLYGYLPETWWNEAK